MLWLPVLAAVLAVPQAASRAPSGRYVEARTASVFAGACHYGAESTTAGREAVLAWHFESGALGGVELAGLDAAAAVAGQGNLADADVTRRSILYVSDRATPAQRDAALAWIRERCAAALGRVEAVKVVPLSVSICGDDYQVEAGGLFAIQGRLLADRACCKMPLSVWYRPLIEIPRPIVGCNALFRYTDKDLGPVWSRRDENTSLAGVFGAAGTAEAPR